MSTAEERRAMMARRGRMRPRPPKNGWTLIVMTVAVVMFIGLVVWVAGARGRLVFSAPTDREVLHELAAGWRARWPQVPGPPQRYREQARAAEAKGRPAEAVDWLTRALAIDEDEAGSWLSLVIVSARGPQGVGLDATQRAAVLQAIEETRADAALLPAARGWQALAAGDPGGALQVLGDSPGTVDGRWAALRARQALGQPAEAQALALLRVAPAHPEGCLVAARAAFSRADLIGAQAIMAPCDVAAAPALGRLMGEILDLQGRRREAIQAYAEAGATLHAAAIAYQEPGLLQEVDVDAILAPSGEGTEPGVAMHRIWCGLLHGRPGWVASGLAALRSPGVSDPALRLAMAAALISRGELSAALQTLGELDSVPALVLRARAGDLQAESLLDTAVARQPWNLAVHRARLAWLQEHDPVAMPAAVEALRQQDPAVWAMCEGWRVRDAPWGAVAPAPWPDDVAIPEHPEEMAEGVSEAGRVWAAAQEAAAAQRNDEARTLLSSLLEGHPERVGVYSALLRLPERVDEGAPRP